MRLVDTGQAQVEPLKPVGEPFVVAAKKVKDRRLEVVDVDGIRYGLIAEFVRLAIP